MPRLYQRLALACLPLAAMLWVVAGCEARQPAAAKADYDYYLLALSLAPAFCEDALGRRQVPHQCRDLDLADFGRQPLTLHGLWPSRRSGRHPSYCKGERDRGDMCDQTPVTLPADLSARLRQLMPGTADCLERHEWARHGSCSALSMAQYFDEAVKLAARANRAMGAVLARHVGREVGLDAVRAALASRDPALLDAVVFDCRTPRSKHPARRRPMLREVRVYFKARPDGRVGEPMRFRDAGVKHFNSGCPAGRAYVDAP